MADIDKTLSELGTSVKIEGPDQEVEIQKQEEITKQPVEVNVKVEKVNPQLEVIYYGTINLTKKGEERTATRFKISQEGTVLVTGNLYKKLVPDT